MRLCDGARLNAVGKGVHLLGRVPPTVCASVTALYLSQNNLRSLEGIEQFAAVRLLSVGGNLIASDKEVARLNELAQLRNLNLMGNPLCDQPNYRLRVVAALKKLQVLDNTDITKKEREAAPTVAAQDDALRTMATQNHFDIQKVQRIAKLIALHKEFYGRVMAGVASGRFDRVPSPNGVACNVKLLLRLWRYEDTLSEQEQEALKVQMLTIIIRTHAKLAENPKVKAKEYLLKLANGSSPRGQRLDGASNDIKQRCASWEEAYANVIALQQKTIANLHALCEKNRREMVEFLKDLLSMDPRQRNQLVGGQRAQQHKDELEMKPPPRQVISPRRSWAGSRYVERQRSHDSFDAHSSQHHLPPQQQDPDARDRKAEISYPSFLPPPPPMLGGPLSPRERSKSQATEIRHSRAQETTITNRTANLRSGDFANKSLGEAIHTFKLRDSQAVPRAEPSAAIPLPTKIPQVHTIYTAQRQDNVILPPGLVEKQRPPFHRRPREQRLRPSSAEFEDEMNRSQRDTDVATDLNYTRRRVSSAFTREDLDMTSISAISHASSSPPRSRRANEEAYVPIAKSPPNPLSEGPAPVPPPPLRATQHSQTTVADRNELQTNPEQPKPTATPNDGRLQELEQREERYIRALMQSEQRELDLRNNLSSVQRKLASYQRTLAQQLHEREAIKEEVAQRTMAVATPKILKRFFIRWIQFYNWSQQIKHVRRKRCFVVQHDHFWQWRRKVWMQQELRACLKKQQLRVRRVHFQEWVNITRLSVIAKRSRMLQETRLLKNILHRWIEGVNRVRREQNILLDQQNGREHRMQRLCFQEWKRATRHKRALTKVQDLRWQESERFNKQVAFWNWKLFLYSVARPIQERSVQLQYRGQCRQTRLHLREWRKLIQIDKLHSFRLRRRLWRRWVDWRRRVETDKHAAHKEKITVAKIYFVAWHSTASEQATSRRSLNLAKRYVNRRRLRKLWMHWKYFSMAKRKYTQDSTKALKHYFIKLLRTSWGKWKQRTHANLQQAKLNKYGILQRHFDAFRTGIRLIRAQNARARMLAHAKKRREWRLLRSVLHGWRGRIVNKKRCKQHAQQVSLQREQGALSTAWRQWRSLHIGNLHNQVSLLRRTYDSVVKEKHELEAHLMAAKHTAMSLTDQIEILHERSKGEDKQVAALEEKLRLCEEHNRSLASELKSARSAIERERHAWEDALCEEEEKRENDSVKYRSLAQENQVLQVQMIELKRELEVEKSKVIEAEKVNHDLRTASVNTADVHHSEMTAAVNKQKELEREIAELREHLKEQETEREDTANRLQEYEKRIASTCEAMNEHEQAHERENERLRSECTNIEAKLKEEQVKNTELNRLLQEKNQMILNMTHRINQGEPSPCRDRYDPSPGHENCGALCGNQNDCGRREPRTALRAEELMIDNHTSKVHEDIRLLQERISKRLEQVPAYAQLPPRPIPRARSQAVITAVSPALAASRLVKSSTFKARDRENVSTSANKPKKKAIRKPSSSTIPTDRSLPKATEKKKATRKQHSGIRSHAGRVL
ncbi:hypothetical protein PHYSODRAFT_308966 [Phytophthora sojae]|uniref:U2A'/phosphoprotein 32 family A C-terminal domain-containing protein n=1 Tax=Phytophthora sojae (strain P6497) TaxID=1094619 RepID=G4YF84_PHYSP|nr:hypothetical protein PHYSODRAFT_308966 [Phytophthora sojae]EGZ27988.1 hypothetical protein PHYSODRAFT_308966 [Phytophthora sojae]|eukprot:XP_009515263.1 hypothetical protein PHYSODRAFT_308966 [Phytophthora sojae]